MKPLITGLVLIAVSGAALIWHLATRTSTAPTPAGPERTAHCMVWKAERGHATVWLCGSIHLLRAEDYPLPAPYLTAFAEAKTLVTESRRDPADEAARQATVIALGKLPEGENLEQRLAPETWSDLQAWCGNSGADPATLRSMKPWQVALHIGNLTMQRLGYSPAHGMEHHFTTRAGGRTLAGLETLEDQLGRFDQLDAATQEAMIGQAIAESKQAEARAQRMLDAWREGDARQLASLRDESLTAFPKLKALLLDARHAAWLPLLEKYLDGSGPVMVLVGSGHLCGRGSLIELLEAKGAELTQMEYRTTRPAAK